MKYLTKDSVFALCVGILASALGIAGYGEYSKKDDPQGNYVSFAAASDLANEAGWLYRWEVSGEVILSNELQLHDTEEACTCQAASVSMFSVLDTIQTGSKFDNPEEFLHFVKLPKNMNQYFLIGKWLDYKIRFIGREKISH